MLIAEQLSFIWDKFYLDIKNLLSLETSGSEKLAVIIANGQHDPSDISKLVELHLKGERTWSNVADLLKASRRICNSTIDLGGWSWAMPLVWTVILILPIYKAVFKLLPLV